MKNPLIITLTLFVMSLASYGEAKKRFLLRYGDLSRLESEIAMRHVERVKTLKNQNVMVISTTEEQGKALAMSTQSGLEEDTVHSLPKWGGFRRAIRPHVVQTVGWGITKIRALEAATRGAGIKVCVSDTGADLKHADLKSNIISQFNTINPRRSAKDDNGHGTHVAGIVAALDNSIGVVGVASQAKLIIAKGLNAAGMGFSSDLSETIDGCRLRGAQIINMSWGSDSPNLLVQQAIERAHAAGIILVAAAGNESTSVIYPAAFPEVVAVSALTNIDELASFSNFGPEVGNSAPGVGILSTMRNGTYGYLSGTSQATPFVAGVAALMLSVFPGASFSDLRGVDIGLAPEQQGLRGRIDAVLSTTSP